MLEVESGISPEMIERRDYWTATTAAEIPDGFDWYQYQAWMFPILVIPQWNSVGRLFTHILRPDHPRRGRDEKFVKYESQPGAPVGFDVPPVMMPLLRDSSVPIYITEGSKKADAMASRGLPCLSLNGVYAFLHKRLVVSEMDEIDFDGREVRIVFDSDVMTKPGVADALNRLAGAIRRRDGHVEMVTLPDNGDGKTGVDDFFVSGGTPADLDLLTRPWDVVSRPRNMIDYADPYAEIARLQQLNCAQAELLRNPHLKDKPRMVGFATITEAASKASRGEVEPDGRVRLEVSRIVNDFRPRPAKGEAMPEINPQDGSYPLTSRDNAKSALKHLIEHGAIDGTFEPVKRQHASGDWYVDTDILVRVPDTTSAIRQLASYSSRTGRKAYTRQDACPACGEVHPRSVRTIHESTCHGCGVTTSNEDPVRIVPVPPAQRPDITENQRAKLDTITASPSSRSERASRKNLEARRTVKASGSPAPSNYVSGKNLEASSTVSQSPILQPPSRSPVDTCTTMGCQNPIPPHRTYICDECAAVLEVAS